ncbi:MAG: POTRA domain-containing protein [Chitinophagaceae bacterium]
MFVAKGQDAGILPPLETPASPRHADTSGTEALFVVRDIVVTGNRKTKPQIILREIPFKPGDHFRLEDLVKKFEDARRQLMNTVLFHDVIVALKSIDGYSVDVMVDVKERWYIFPIPYFKTVDRNWNQWIVENKASFTRVNYGIKLLYNNFTGYNDKLRVWLINGYTKQLSLNYDRLYIDKQLKWGMNIGMDLGKNREINYITDNNKQLFFKDPSQFIGSFFRAYGELTYRRAIKTRHRIGIAFNQQNISDTINKLNPAYFKFNKSSIRYPEIYYVMSYYDQDYIPYPTRGYAAEVTVNKKGLNDKINLWQLTLKGSANYVLFPKTYLGIRANGILKMPFKQPYIYQQLLGYGDLIMQGYEYYVMDGVAGGVAEASLAREVFSFKINIPPNRFRTSGVIPVRIIPKIYGDAGYAHNPDAGNNPLTNKMLYSWGIGLDIITLYDFTLKLEWSFNQLGQNGLYLHNRNSSF